MTRKKLLFANFAHRDHFHAQLVPPAKATELKVSNEGNFSLPLINSAVQ
jgi:hypothetical protein